MGTMSELAAELTELHSIGESLIELADKLKMLIPVGEAASSAPEETKSQETAAKEYSLPEVRAVLAEKARAGKTAEIRSLLSSYGAEKLSDIPPEKYSALMKDAERI